MVTILQVVPRLDAGGSELTTVEIAEALLLSGAKALVVTEGGRMAEAIKAAGGEVINLPVASKSPVTMLANARSLARIVRDRGVDLVHARSRAPAWSALLACRRTGRPFVTTYHGAYGEVGPLKAAYNNVMAKGDLVIANSHYTASLVASREPKANGRIRVIYRGVEGREYDPAAISASAADEIRKEWGVPAECRIVLHAARLTRGKGQRQLVAAAARLKAAGKLDNAAFVLAGEGGEAYRRRLLSLISRHGLDDKVLLVGHCQDMAAAYLSAHVTVTVSTVPEAFGRTSIEAQAMGCPVIVPDIGASPETIVSSEQDQAGFTGWLVPGRDVEALASRLEQVLSLPDPARDEIGARAREFVTARFTLKRMQEMTLAVYDELLGTELATCFRGGSG
jgi:glycosyltransferase involved in cell wall biosynthesis